MNGSVTQVARRSRAWSPANAPSVTQTSRRNRSSATQSASIASPAIQSRRPRAGRRPAPRDRRRRRRPRRVTGDVADGASTRRRDRRATSSRADLAKMGGASTMPRRPGRSADLVLLGGNDPDDGRRRAPGRRDLDPGRPDRGGGRRGRRRAAAPAGARRVDLDGATVLPGFIDAHCHIGALAYLLGNGRLRAGGRAHDPGVLEALEQARGARPRPGAWVAGHSFAENGVAERRFPTRTSWTRPCRDRPCVVFHRSMHACILNTPRPRGRRPRHSRRSAVRQARSRRRTGRPDGTVYEAPMFELFADTSADVPRRARTTEHDPAGRRRPPGCSSREGVTTVMDADLPGRRRVSSACVEVDAAGALPLRVVAMVNDRDADAMHAAGVLGGRGRRALARPGRQGLRGRRHEQPDRRGPSRVHGAAVRSRGALPRPGRDDRVSSVACEAGASRSAVHSQGDRGDRDGARRVRDGASARAAPAGNPSPPPDRARRDARCRVSSSGRPAIGIHVVSQPGFFSTLADGWLEAYGEETHVYYPFRSLRAAGLRVGGSSDAPVITPNVRRGAARRGAARRRAGVVVGAPGAADDRRCPGGLHARRGVPVPRRRRRGDARSRQVRRSRGPRRRPDGRRAGGHRRPHGRADDRWRASLRTAPGH